MSPPRGIVDEGDIIHPAPFIPENTSFAGPVAIVSMTVLSPPPDDFLKIRNPILPARTTRTESKMTYGVVPLDFLLLLSETRTGRLAVVEFARA